MLGKTFSTQRTILCSRLLTRVFGSRNERLLRGFTRYVRAANELEHGRSRPSPTRRCAPRPTSSAQRLKDGATLDELLPEAFAVVREAALRTLRMRHFDVQLIGGIVLHKGMIAEMRTGEGKTLVATLPAYLNALAGEGVHIVTVNEYLAQRDADWMGPVYRFLGLTRRASSRTRRTRRRSARPTPATSPTAPTTNSASTTCATTSRSASRTACSAASPSRSSTRSTRS